jgi:small subunit ribosomal protein S27Ae
MHILVQTLTGQKCELNIDSSNKISTINAEIENVMGVPMESQKLIFNGKRLDSEMLISEFSITEESCINLVVALEGGAKGKKKKKLVKKNKKPHKHRKNKLGILSYYKVDGDNVVRLRQQCKLCPPGNIT